MTAKVIMETILKKKGSLKHLHTKLSIKSMSVIKVLLRSKLWKKYRFLKLFKMRLSIMSKLLQPVFLRMMLNLKKKGFLKFLRTMLFKRRLMILQRVFLRTMTRKTSIPRSMLTRRGRLLLLMTRRQSVLMR